MKNTPSLSKLVALIRSLGQAQKRDFKKYVKFWGGRAGRKYIVLFDAVQYFFTTGQDEENLCAFLLKRKKFGEKPGDLTSSATYLYRKILESMRTTPDGAPHFNRLNALMQDINFLYSKNLYADCKTLVEEALLLARQLDKPAYELELNFWKSKMSAWQGEHLDPDEPAAWLQHQENLADDLCSTARCAALLAESRPYIQKKSKMPEPLDQRLQQLAQEHNKGLTSTLPLRAKLQLFIALGNYYDLKHALSGGTSGGLVKKVLLEKSLSYHEMALDLYRSNKVFAEEEQLNFVGLVDTYINRCLRAKKTELVEQMEAELAQGKNELVKYRTVAYNRLQHHLAFNEFRQAQAYFEENKIAAGIEKFKNRIPENRLLALRFTVAQVYYALDDFDLAGDWFGQIARMRTEVRPGAVTMCKVLEIICLWEHGVYRNDADTARPVKNLRRSFRRAKLLDGFTGEMLDTVELVFRNHRALTKAGLPAKFEGLKSELENDQSKYLYGLVLAWLEARLNRTTIGKEILKYQH